MTIKRLVFCLCCALALTRAAAQKFPEHAAPQEPRNKGSAILIHLTGGLQLPGGDLADRFGNNGVLGGGVEYLTTGNWIVGLESEFIFGSKVHDDPLAILRTPEGDIIGNDRTVASLVLRERGLYTGALVGRLFTFGREERSGLRVTLGAGWLQHKIRLQDDNNTVTQITGDYAKGYDRLTAGLALNQFLGWQTLAPDRRANFMIGFEFNQGFTQSRRDWDFTEMRKLDGQRLDLRFGLRASWTLPFYVGGAEKIYY